MNLHLILDPVKFRLSSLEAASTIIKLSSVIYPPTSWSSYNEKFSEEEFCEEWSLRCAISNWGWRTISALKDLQDESKYQGLDIPLFHFEPFFLIRSTNNQFRGFAMDYTSFTEILSTAST